MTESEAKPKAKGPSRASKPRKSASKSKSPSKRSETKSSAPTSGWLSRGSGSCAATTMTWRTLSPTGTSRSCER
jgi:hypothetical protein